MESGKATFKVPENFEDEKESGFVVSFTNGQLLRAAKNKPRFTLYNKAKDRTKRRRLLVAETDHMTYVGSNYDPEALVGGNNGCRYCIGEMDRESGTLTLHKADFIVLNPYIPGQSDSCEQQLNDTTPIKPDHRKSIDQMVSMFGSEKQKRAFSAAKRNKVESDVLETALATAVTHAQNEIEKMSTETDSFQTSGLMPPFNPLAEVPQDVYKLEDIISLGVISSLKKSAKLFKKATLSNIAEWRGEKRYPEYALQHVSSLPTTEPMRSLKAAVLLFVCCLVKMHNMSTRMFQKEGIQLDGFTLPVDAKEELLSKFTERQDGAHSKVIYSLSTRMKDKIRLHLFAVTLILDNFVVDCQSLQQDLRLNTARVMNFYKALGCTVSKKAVKRKAHQNEDELSTSTQSTNSCTAVLKIPLNFPKTKKNRQSQK